MSKRANWSKDLAEASCGRVIYHDAKYCNSSTALTFTFFAVGQRVSFHSNVAPNEISGQNVSFESLNFQYLVT